MLKITINWNDYLVNEEDVPSLAAILCNMRNADDSRINFSIQEAPDRYKEQLKKEITEEIGEEIEEYRKYWQSEVNKTKRLEKELEELRNA